jgi:AraC family transcriptional regulator, transcriptional activator of pobA
MQTQTTQLDIQPLQHSLPHCHQHIEIVWLRTGGGSLDIDLKRYKMAGNSLYCILPGQLHTIRIDANSEGCIIAFPESLLNSGNDDFDLLYRSGLFQLLMQFPAMAMERPAADEIDAIIRRLYKELYNGYLLKTEIMRGYTSIFLICLARHFGDAMQTSVQTTNAMLVKNFITLVEKKFISCKRVREYASALSVTPTYLNGIVKKISGSSAGCHIRQRVVLEAKRRAAYSNMSMKEIAYYLGFEDLAQFSKFFKAVNGKTFTDFKKDRFSYFQ